MNSYFLAIHQASGHGLYPELGDAWRNYHATALISDSEYFYR